MMEKERRGEGALRDQKWDRGGSRETERKRNKKKSVEEERSVKKKKRKRKIKAGLPWCGGRKGLVV